MIWLALRRRLTMLLVLPAVVAFFAVGLVAVCRSQD